MMGRRQRQTTPRARRARTAGTPAPGLPITQWAAVPAVPGAVSTPTGQHVSQRGCLPGREGTPRPVIAPCRALLLAKDTPAHEHCRPARPTQGSISPGL